jgi:hypothetical protein
MAVKEGLLTTGVSPTDGETIDEARARGLAIHKAEALFGPTVTLPTATLFAVAGAMEAMIYFVAEPVPSEECPEIFDRADLHDLHETLLEVVAPQMFALLPFLKDLPEEASDDDARVLAQDALLDAFVAYWTRGLRKRFNPPLAASRAIDEMTRDLRRTSTALDRIEAAMPA